MAIGSNPLSSTKVISATPGFRGLPTPEKIDVSVLPTFLGTYMLSCALWKNLAWRAFGLHNRSYVTACRHATVPLNTVLHGEHCRSRRGLAWGPPEGRAIRALFSEAQGGSAV
jgi:hypothetical protein